ncbi:MAG: FliG C-terminal domain-containing protein [Hydrogenovibrio sp.]|nr:FliG C-terminal domain-containing protein [Hydrogenovibrio sp.]
MEISAKRGTDGEYLLEMGYVTIELPYDAVRKLQSIIDKRLNQSSDVEQQSLDKKIKVYRELANKLVNTDDRIIQKVGVQMTPEQLVTIARLADGERLFHKIMRNLSRQNGKQFQEDFLAFDKITEHQACVNMDKVVPLIRQAAQEQKQGEE